ncbi:MAG: PAS domain S-box protein, partial [Methanococcaceae archaeon]
MSSEKRKTILLVEDEAILALSGKITLGKIGYNILIANTGEKAVKMIETMSSENPIDLILMDIDLGAGISGPEAAVQILKDRTIPIVFHTSHAEREMVETVRGITRYGYVIKNSGDFVLQSSIEMAFELFDSHKQLLNELKERQLAQDALKKSEEKFYKAFEASPNAIAISSLDTGIYIDVNEAFLTMTGYKKDEIIGHTSTEIEIWADITEREKFINKLVQDGYLRNFEASYRMKNKEVKDFLVSSETIELEGKHCGINFILDITESKQAEIKLRNAAVETQRLRIALDYVSAHIYMKDSKFRYIYANQSTLELFGCSAGELINCDDSCFFPPETVAQLRKIDARVLQGEQTTEEIVVKDDSGKQQIFWEIKTPIYADAQNKTILGLLGISTDITSRKKVEEDLIESKKQYENLVSKIPVGIYIFHTKPDGSFLFDYISPGIAALFN